MKGERVHGIIVNIHENGLIVGRTGRLPHAMPSAPAVT
jgi:hypothetical protein